jgi:hypothetical protein
MRVWIQRRPMRFGADVVFYEAGIEGGVATVYKFGTGEIPESRTVENSVMVPDDVKLYLPDGALEALVEAAQEAGYGGSPNRIILDALSREQKRVDQFIEWITDEANSG